MKASTFLGILFAATLFCLDAYAEDKPKLAVMNLAAEQGIAEGTVKILNEMLLTEVQATGRFGSVIGQRDIVAMLTLESLRLKLSECSDESCLVEIGGALGVGHMLSGNMGRVGEKFVLNLKLINVKATRVEARTTITTDPSEDELMVALKKAVREVLAGAPHRARPVL